MTDVFAPFTLPLRREGDAAIVDAAGETVLVIDPDRRLEDDQATAIADHVFALSAPAAPQAAGAGDMRKLLQRAFWRLSFDAVPARDNPGDCKWRLGSQATRLLADAAVEALRASSREPVALPTDEGGCIAKRFVIFTTPGEVPKKKGGWLKDEHLIDFLRAVMLHDDWKPGFRASVLELTWDNDLWASSATEYLSMHDDAIGPRRARKAWEAARAKHERIYKTSPKMKLGDEIDSYRKATAITDHGPSDKAGGE